MSFRDLQKDIQRLIDKGGGIDVDRVYFSTPAPNAIEWITRAEYLNAPQLYTHFGAFEMVRDFFELACPVCNKPEDLVLKDQTAEGLWTPRPRSFIESATYLVWQPRFDDDACPRCGETRYGLIERGLLKGYNQANAVCGQRSGKSNTLAYIGTYVEHFVYCMGHHTGSLQSYLRDVSGAQYEITFMAASMVQAKDTVWAKYKNTRRNGPWYQRYLAWLQKEQDRQEERPGLPPWEYSESQTQIEHGLFQLKINSLNSNSATGRGRTRIAVGMDELSWMRATASEFSAEENYNAMENSLMTVRAKAGLWGLPPWLGAIVSISSPSSVDDKGMQLLRTAAMNPRMYTLHRATQEFAPVTAEEWKVYRNKQKKDPVAYERDFNAQPPTAVTPLIPDFKGFMRVAVDPTATSRAQFGVRRWVSPMGTRFVGPTFVDADFDDASATRVVCFDAGRNFDAFAAACARAEIGEDGEVQTVFEWYWRVVPGPGEEVHFMSVVPLMKALNERMPVLRTRFDRWQSVAMQQELRDAGIDAEIETMPDAAMIDFMRDGYGGRILMLPPPEAELPYVVSGAVLDEDEEGARTMATLSPETVMLREFSKLERDERDRVFNPQKGRVRGENSDDLARVAAYCHRLVKHIGYTKRASDNSRETRALRVREAFQAWDAHFPGGGITVRGGGTRRW